MGSSTDGTTSAAPDASTGDSTGRMDTGSMDSSDGGDGGDGGDGDPYGPCPCGDELCAGLGGAETCTVPCAQGMACPGAGTCVAQLDPGPPTHCALECDPAEPACPSGMTCVDLDDDPAVAADGICGWPTD